jgi:5'-nucleotidase
MVVLFHRIMKLLIGNDDGIFSPGIRTLANTLAIAGHSVIIVCPDRERSATGHGLTIHKPIRAEQVEGLFLPEVEAWACSGTPADCIKLALEAILEHPPDLLLSGINQGANLGTDVLYSGTVSAAMEGAIAGIPSIALSLASFTHHDFQPGADYAVKLVHHLQMHPLKDFPLLNVNIPPLEMDAIHGVQITRQGIRRYHDLFEKRIDPRGKTYYWLAGEVLEEVEDPAMQSHESHLMTDVAAIRKGMISVTPLQYNLTSYDFVSALNDWMQKGVTSPTNPL